MAFIQSPTQSSHNPSISRGLDPGGGGGGGGGHERNIIHTTHTILVGSQVLMTWPGEVEDLQSHGFHPESRTLDTVESQL